MGWIIKLNIAFIQKLEKQYINITSKDSNQAICDTESQTKHLRKHSRHCKVNPSSEITEKEYNHKEISN